MTSVAVCLQVFVFDFGSELYLWQGKGVSPTARKVSMKLAQQLWSQGYDYSTCEVNPLDPLRGAYWLGLLDLSCWNCLINRVLVIQDVFSELFDLRNERRC